MGIQHNPWIEMGANAIAYFNAYRGLCRMRIEYSTIQAERSWNRVDDCPHDECKRRADFWTRTGKYWKQKYEESFRNERAYFAPADNDSTDCNATSVEVSST